VHTIASIKTVSSHFRGRMLDLPEIAGVYAFWWMGDKALLLAAHRTIALKGPNGQLVHVELQDWWPSQLAYPCLYVGKSTNIKKRFSLHIKRDCPGQLHRVAADNRKLKPCTTSCQLRYGIEHLFRSDPDPLAIIFNSVGFSYRTDFKTNAVAERFYTEDLLVGTWRPWFNVDSER
jgi:hypothetical protein